MPADFKKQINASMRRWLALAMLGVSMLGGAAQAQSYLGDVMTIAGAWAKATPPASHTTAVYMTLLNNSNNLDQLTGATTPVADTVEIRDSEKKNMLIEEVPLQSSDAVTFKPGGLHLVLIGLKKQLAPREKFLITLQFKHATAATAEVTVIPPDDKLPLGIEERGWQ